ncbi:hypothetical protein [Streptomyces pristinaespiralis]|jgi:hypothetical protein|uniref:hypothetical protein n=1 Tax=Streptomyces pristinaespiralis TaxID=38300 RepID=UPI0038341AE8
MNRHERLAREYWQTYRPTALAQLGSRQEQEAFFYALGLRVTQLIGQRADEMLLQVPMGERARARAAVKAQATELVYGEEIYLPKEPGTEHREM